MGVFLLAHLRGHYVCTIERMAQHLGELLIGHYLVLHAVHQHRGCRRCLPLRLALTHDGAGVGHHGGWLPVGREHCSRQQRVSTAVVHLQYGYSASRTAGEHNAIGINAKLGGMLHHPRTGGGAVLGGDVDAPLEERTGARERGITFHHSAVFQAQTVVGTHHREATFRQHTRHLALVAVVALSDDEAAPEEGHHAGRVGSRCGWTPHVEH